MTIGGQTRTVYEVKVGAGVINKLAGNQTVFERNVLFCTNFKIIAFIF